VPEYVPAQAVATSYSMQLSVNHNKSNQVSEPHVYILNQLNQFLLAEV